MNGKAVVAVDAMGGDKAPGEIVAGALAAATDGLARIILVGDREAIAPHLGGRTDVEIVDVKGTVAMDEPPASAVKRADGTSLGVAVNLVKEQRANAVVSAGNSGAFLGIALIRLRTIPGIARPAIAAVLPIPKGPVILLDAGANVDCRPEWLMQFGVMGSAYARLVLGIERPRVAVVSVGEERSKGNAQVIEAAELLDGAPVDFIGNVEGKDIFEGVADVLVTDGFVGNVILKLAEGAVGAIGDVVRSAIMESGPMVKAGAFLVRPALQRLRTQFDYETYGGAPLLGLRGNCIVAHGRATRIAIRNAIHAAAVEAEADVVGKIATLLPPLVAKEA